MRVVLADDDTLAAVSLKTILEAETGLWLLEWEAMEGKRRIYMKKKSRIYF